MHGGLDVEAEIALGAGERGAPGERPGGVVPDQQRRERAEAERGEEDDGLARPGRHAPRFPAPRAGTHAPGASALLPR